MSQSGMLARGLPQRGSGEFGFKLPHRNQISGGEQTALSNDRM